MSIRLVWLLTEADPKRTALIVARDLLSVS